MLTSTNVKDKEKKKKEKKAQSLCSVLLVMLKVSREGDRLDTKHPGEHVSAAIT